MCMVDTMSSSSFSSRELNAQLKRALSGQQQGRRRMVDVWRRSRYSSIIAKRTIMHTHTGDEPKKRCLHIIMSLLLLDRFADICTLTREKSHGNLSEKNLSDFTLIWFSFLSFVRKPLEKSTRYSKTLKLSAAFLFNYSRDKVKKCWITSLQAQLKFIFVRAKKRRCCSMQNADFSQVSPARRKQSEKCSGFISLNIIRKLWLFIGSSKVSRMHGKKSGLEPSSLHRSAAYWYSLP